MDVGRKLHELIVQLYKITHHPHVSLRLAASLDQSMFCAFVIFQSLFDFFLHQVILISEQMMLVRHSRTPLVVQIAMGTLPCEGVYMSVASDATQVEGRGVLQTVGPVLLARLTPTHKEVLREQPGSTLPKVSFYYINILTGELGPGRYGSAGLHHSVLAVGQHDAGGVAGVAHQTDSRKDTSTVDEKRIFINFFANNLKFKKKNFRINPISLDF